MGYWPLPRESKGGGGYNSTIVECGFVKRVRDGFDVAGGSVEILRRN